MLVTSKHWNPCCDLRYLYIFEFSPCFCQEQQIKVVKFIKLITGKKSIGSLEWSNIDIKPVKFIKFAGDRSE